MGVAVVPARQRGASFFSIMMFLIVAGIFFTVGFKLFSPYKDHATFKSILENVIHDPEQISKDFHDIRRTIYDRAVINQVREDLSTDKYLTIVNKDGVLNFDLKYEERVPMFYNVDAVVKFHDHYEVNAP